MLIIDKNNKHDFYDAALAFGIDRSIVYQREEKYLTVGIKTDYPDYSYGIGEKIFPIVIGFCGKLYHCFKTVYEVREKYQNTKTLVKYIYDIETLDEFMKEYYSDSNYFDKPEKKEYYIKFRKHNCEKFFNGEYVNSDLKNIFIDYKVPCFAFHQNKFRRDICDVDKNNLVLNPLLKDYGFQKVMDAVTCNQEIMMYLSGVLGVGEKETVVPSDKSKIVKAGFDVKTSFRNVK